MSRQKKRSEYVFLRKPLQRLIKKATKRAESAGREICGFIVGHGSLLELVRVKNKTKEPGAFSLSWKQYRKVKRAARVLGYRVVGTFHSHPVSSAVPGPSDIEGAKVGELMLIVACWGKQAKLWRIRKGKANQLPFREIDL